MKEGWIGDWSPGIGDPTIGGWLTVLLYAWVAWGCLRVVSRQRMGWLVLKAHEPVIWRLLAMGLILLGINKQLDLQSAMTEVARTWAVEQGWYDHRRQYQAAFIAAVVIMGVTSVAAMVITVWGSHAATLWACVGTAGLVVFVAVRAASFHHVDEALGWHLVGLPLNWVLEMGSLAVIGWSAHARARLQS